MFTFSLRGTTPSVVLPSPFLIIVRERYWPIQGRCTHFLCNCTTRLDGCVVSFERGLVLTLLRKINYLATVHLSSMAQPSLARLALILLLNLCVYYPWVFFLYIFIFIFDSVSSVSSSLFAFASRLEFDDFILMRVCKIRSIWTSYCNVTYVFLIFQISIHSEWLLSWWGWDLFIKSHDAGTSGDP